MHGPAGCCAPGRSAASAGGAGSAADSPAGAAGLGTAVALDGGWFLLGCEDPGAYADDGEGPVRRTRVDPFLIGTRCVANADFAAFVDATGYVTDAERFGASFVFAGLLPDDFPPTRGVVGAEWWREVEGADWRHPAGPQSSLDGMEDHPAVHVSWRDADTYCGWAGVRLPTEAEWEFAARGGLEGKRFPWGDALRPDGEHRMNVWQGRFPTHNTLGDGYLGTAPVGAFPPNGYGLYNMTGNVWEWTGDSFSATGDRKALRGGSYLCHVSYCYRYRVSARMGNTVDSSTGNIGFRCARSA